MELFVGANSYKTRPGAIKALAKVADLKRERWFIVANCDGRFSPCVVRNDDNVRLIHCGICVVG